MRAIPPDYEPPENEGFDKFPEGKHKVSSFEWFTLNENKQPILKTQKDMKMVGRLRFNLPDGKIGPPFSLTLGEMGLLVRAFGKDPTSLPPLPELNQPIRITEYMQAIERVCQGKEVEVEVNKDGWVSSIKGFDVPEDYFYFQLSDISPKDEKGNPFHKEGPHGHYFFVEFEIYFGEGGSETPYKGAKFTEIMSYAVDVGENGKLDWARTEKEKVYTQSATRLSKLVRLTAPSMKLLEQEYDFSNPHNILPDWSKHAQNDKVMLKGNRAKNEDTRRIQLLWPSLQSVDGYEPSKEVLNLSESDIKGRVILNDLFDYLGEEKTVQNNNLTPTGIELAKKYISPIKQQGLVKHGSFLELDYDDVMAIFNYVEKTIVDDEKIKQLKIDLIHAGVGFDAPEPVEAIQDEWGSADSPF